MTESRSQKSNSKKICDDYQEYLEKTINERKRKNTEKSRLNQLYADYEELVQFMKTAKPETEEEWKKHGVIVLQRASEAGRKAHELFFPNNFKGNT